MTQFRKMHGLGNDFVIFDARTDSLFLTPQDMALVADRHWGVGCDQVVVIDESEKADVFVYFFNADGSEGGACGNATRCVADLVMNEKKTETCSVEAIYGVLECSRENGLIRVNMGAPRDIEDLKLTHEGVSNPVSVNMGNPHCVFFVEDVEIIDIEKIGKYFEHHQQFPDRTNVEFVQVIDRTHLRQRTWERGVGITQACGSGACATAVAAIHRGLVDDKVEIILDGGILQLEWEQGENPVYMTGPVAYVFEGTLHTD